MARQLNAFKVLAACIIALGVSGCEHMCLNYVDCDSQVKMLRQQIAELRKENRKLRLYSVNDKCDEVTYLEH